MKLPITAVLVVCMAITSVSTHAIDLFQFDRPSLGIPWNASPEQLQLKFPGLKKSVRNHYVYRGQWEVGPPEYQDDVLLFTFDAAGLKQVYCSLPNADALELIATLNQRIGPGRSASYREGNVFQHVHEWVRRDHVVLVHYLAATADPMSAPIASKLEANLTVLRDRPERSEVDAALQLPKLAEEMNRRMREAHAKAQQEKLAKAQAAPKPPTPVNAIGAAPPRKAGTTWGAALNPAGYVPVGSFKAFYIRKSQPRTVVASEVVPDVAINYAYDQFHGIRSEDFGAYWVGRLEFESAETRMITVSQSWAKTRVIIDGNVVYDGGSDVSIPYEFSAGEHLVEVEYLNSWHTTEVKIGFGQQLAQLTKEQVRGELERRGMRGTDVYYVGLYESKAQDLGVAVNLGQLRRDSVLVLSSYSAIKWILAGPTLGKVKAVIIGSYSPGSEVTGISDKVPVLLHRGRIGDHEFTPRCHCVGGRFHCESSSSLLTMRESVVAMTGGTLLAASTGYAAASVSVPGQAITDDVIEKSAVARNAVELARAECEKDPDFETLMR
nr:hypothetical protein [uncultured Steroidobacter sp.]